MKYWMVMWLSAILTLASGVMSNYVAYNVPGGQSPQRPSRRILFSLILTSIAFIMAGKQFDSWINPQIAPAPAPAPTVVHVTPESTPPQIAPASAPAPTVVYVTPESTPPPQEETKSPKNALTKIDPPSDKAPTQNVLPPTSLGELAKRQEFAEQQQQLARAQEFAKEERAKEERDKLERARLLEEERRKQFFYSLHRRTGVPY
jgi:hypothetical protein